MIGVWIAICFVPQLVYVSYVHDCFSNECKYLTKCNNYIFSEYNFWNNISASSLASIFQLLDIWRSKWLLQKESWQQTQSLISIDLGQCSHNSLGKSGTISSSFVHKQKSVWTLHVQSDLLHCFWFMPSLIINLLIFPNLKILNWKFKSNPQKTIWILQFWKTSVLFPNRLKMLPVDSFS